MRAQIVSLVMLLCLAILICGCAPGITRTGYKLPPGKTTKDLDRCNIAIRCNAGFDTNAVTVLGSIHAYDTGFSTDCDEAAILDIFCREGCVLGADIVDITEEKQPNPLTSTCYRAKAAFLRFNDRSMATNLVSDAKYAPNLIIERSAAAGKRNEEVIAGAVLGGPLGAVIVTAATAPDSPTNHANAVGSPRAAQNR